MAIYVKVQDRRKPKIREKNALRLLYFFFDQLKTTYKAGSKHVQIGKVEYSNFIFWTGPPIEDPSEKHDFESTPDLKEFINKKKEKFNQFQSYSWEIQFTQSFYVKEVELVYEGSLFYENHTHRIADISIHYFPIDHETNFDSLIQNKAIWLYFRDHLLAKWTNDLKHEVVNQINVGVHAFPMDNLLHSRMLYFANRADFIQILLNNMLKYYNQKLDKKNSEYVGEITLERYKEGLRDGNPEFFSKYLDKKKVYTTIEGPICRQFNVTPALTHSILLKDPERNDLTPCLLSLSKELIDIYRTYYRPPTELDKILESRAKSFQK